MLPDKLYYNIREVSAHFEVAPSLLRFWEKEFPHLITKRNARGVRFYTRENIDQIDLIYDLVKRKGYTLEGARARMKNLNSKAETKHGLKQTLTEVRDILEKFKHVLNEME